MASRAACRSLAHLGTRAYSAVSNTIPAAKQKYVPNFGTYPKGFTASGIHVGVKATNTSSPDLCLIASTSPCSAAAVFTKNKFKAAPVLTSRKTLEVSKGKDVRAIVVNSGCANAVTGKGGLDDAEAMGAEVDRLLSTESNTSIPEHSQCLVMSTGVIGQRLPIQKILHKIPTAYGVLQSTHEAWMAAARAICTTDTFPKLLSRTFTLPSSPLTTYSLAGMTKGAGMIHPNMATLLAMIFTDVPVPNESLKPLLTHAVDRSFNCISVDGDMSTNDTLCLLANGAAGGPGVSSRTDYSYLQDTLTEFAADLAKLVVRDGEGATKFVTVKVVRSPTREDAKAVASTIARSPLVKTALYGKDANWGRILCATGYADAPGVWPDSVSVSFVPTDGSEALKLLVNGEPERVDEERAAEILAFEDLEILVDLGGGESGMGIEEAVYWTCDFSHEYITINGDYRT
ncbi:MAG: hypothetical protein M1814_006137 [Vezdaea aestivalis]|nr:MAG: hypothetical protein M1814_006137 [Vezdaea aestivalis]